MFQEFLFFSKSTFVYKFYIGVIFTLIFWRIKNSQRRFVYLCLLFVCRGLYKKQNKLIVWRYSAKHCKFILAHSNYWYPCVYVFTNQCFTVIPSLYRYSSKVEGLYTIMRRLVVPHPTPAWTFQDHGKFSLLLFIDFVSFNLMFFSFYYKFVHPFFSLFFVLLNFAHLLAMASIFDSAFFYININISIIAIAR